MSWTTLLLGEWSVHTHVKKGRGRQAASGARGSKGSRFVKFILVCSEWGYKHLIKIGLKGKILEAFTEF
jgi:hypothetical protein